MTQPTNGELESNQRGLHTVGGPFGYDVLGLIQSVTSSAGNKSFSYDKGNQLLSQEISSPQLNEVYTYDEAGNWTSRTATKNGVATNTAYSYNDNKQLKTNNHQNYSYNANGNGTKDTWYKLHLQQI
ncbi:hypothetical protein [Sporosarcina sp. D27]|uniref:hypothetical protein n=1 Tax=Sporosarcina sp. D27 TaxID=1382305 RepID=UPI00046FEA73|nr:hypothetical protein [Sporosarcina sp. D27]